MANSLYTNGKEAILDGSVVWLTSNIKVMLVDTTIYTKNLTSDKFLSDIPIGARAISSPLLTGKTAAGGVADADDATITTVTAAGTIGAYVIYDDTGSPSTSRLLAVYDTMTGLPFTPNGGSVLIQWPNTAGKIFSL